MKFAKKMIKTAINMQKEMYNLEKPIVRSLQVINESLELSHSSPNPETRISRRNVAIETLSKLHKNYAWYPESPIWRENIDELTSINQAFLMTNLYDFIKIEVEKIEALKSVNAKHNRVLKLETKLNEYFSFSECDTKWLHEQIALLTKAYPEVGKEPVKEGEIPTQWEIPEEIKRILALQQTEVKPKSEKTKKAKKVDENTQILNLAKEQNIEYKKVSIFMKIIRFIGFFFVFFMFYISFIYDKESQTTNYFAVIGVISVLAFMFTSATVTGTHVIRIKKILADKEEQ